MKKPSSLRGLFIFAYEDYNATSENRESQVFPPLVVVGVLLFVLLRMSPYFPF